MVSQSPEQTKIIAADLVHRILPDLSTGPVVIALLGDYGTGKTQFVKGLAETLGVEQPVVSPSYVYMRNYPFVVPNGKGELVHIDAWRVKQESDFQLLGVEEYLKPGYIIAIEWPQEYAGTLQNTMRQSGVPYRLIEISIADLGGEQREISVPNLDA